MQNDRHWIHPRMAERATFPLLAGTLAVLLAGPAGAQVDPAAKADVTGDGTVNILDISTIGSRFGLQAGQAGYRGGLDLNADSDIGMPEFMEVLSQFGTTGAPTTGTMFRGTVFDGLGNRLQGVRVLVGDSVEGCTDRNGAYAIPIGPADFGENLATFVGPFFDPNTGASMNSCDADAVDPTPDFLSGQYPTIPNKPVYINAGIDNVFRAIPLPERDLTGSQDLSQGGVATNVGGDSWKLNKKVKVRNAGVKLGVPAGCTATFPAGEDPVLSITRVAPDRLPVPMPPGLSSTLFVTYQPGSTEIDCPAGSELFTEFDNDDGFPVGPGNLNVGPFLAGITNGVFTPLVACEVLVGGATVSCGPIPTPFDFAWYHTDIRPLIPCPRTSVTGQVIDVGNNGSPVAGASVSVPGAVPVLTDPLGQFSIPNVPAGPNGPACFSNPFSIRAAASAELNGQPGLQSKEFGVSKLGPAVPGGFTDLLAIPLGIEGGAVQGRVLKLSSIDPFVVVPLPGAFVDLHPFASDNLGATTDSSGNYSFADVPQGPYDLHAEFSGELPAPGGGTEFKEISGELDGNIEFAGQVEVQDFRFTGTGAVQVTVVDQQGIPQPFMPVDLRGFGGDLGAGFVAPQADCFGLTDENGVVTFSAENFSCFSREADVSGVPLGSCEASVVDFSSEIGSSLGTAGPDDGCVVNQHGQLVELTIEVTQPGDVDEVRVSQAILRDASGADIEVVELRIKYGDEFIVDSFFDVFFDIELDTDQDQATGAPSHTSDLSPHGPTNLGVDLRIGCDLRGQFCDVSDANGSPVDIDVNFFEFRDQSGLDPMTLVMLINKPQLIAAAGPGPYNSALLSVFFGGGEPFNVFGFGETLDVVPNGGNVEVDPNGFEQVFDDPLGDTFSEFFIED